MAEFKYAAKGPGGTTVEGTIQAETKAEAVAELRKKDLIILRLDEGSGRKRPFGRRKASASAGKAPTRGGRAKKGEVVIFTRQLATMVGAGLSLLESLDVLGHQAESKGMKQTCQVLVDAVRGGSDLSAAMEQCPRSFTPLYISMVKAGEVSGQMDIILNRLADYMEAAEELSREIKSAMTYPVISMVLVVGITMFLMMGVVPTFKSVFESLDTDLPAITQMVLDLSNFLRANAVLVIGGMFTSIVGTAVFKKTTTGQRFFDHLLLRLPVFGVLFQKVCLARFSRTFATLVRSGVPIMATLDIVAATSGNWVLTKAVLASRDSVRSGNLLSEPLASEKIFPPMVTRMIAIGERTGALETLLEKIAEFYDSQVKAQVKALTSLIEPLLIAFMGIVVGGVVLAIFMPILNMVSNLSAG
ncbi:MAG: type II secretion system F family protein [Planctomycetota bacterium]|nr:type II secretion system F family protein [Planctomycetota bacterium]